MKTTQCIQQMHHGSQPQTYGKIIKENRSFLELRQTVQKRNVKSSGRTDTWTRWEFKRKKGDHSSTTDLLCDGGQLPAALRLFITQGSMRHVWEKVCQMFGGPPVNNATMKCLFISWALLGNFRWVQSKLCTVGKSLDKRPIKGMEPK